MGRGNNVKKKKKQPRKGASTGGAASVAQASSPLIFAKLADSCPPDVRLQACEEISQLVLEPQSLPTLLHNNLLSLLALRLEDIEWHVRCAAAATVRNLSGLGDDVCQKVVDSGLLDVCTKGMVQAHEACAVTSHSGLASKESYVTFITHCTIILGNAAESCEAAANVVARSETLSIVLQCADCGQHPLTLALAAVNCLQILTDINLSTVSTLASIDPGESI